MIQQFLSSNPFLIMAMLAGLLASFAGGVVGCYVVAKRIVFISGSIAHAVLGGLGITLYVNRVYDLPWLSPVYGALIFSILSALIIGIVNIKFKEREDTIIGALWTFGMALGVIFLSLTPGYNVEVMNFLFGNILWSNAKDLIILGALDTLLLLIIAFFHRRFLAICFDENQARLQKAPVQVLYFLLLCTIAITIVLLIQVVGVILVMSMLTIPAACANFFSHRLSKMMSISVLFGMLFTLSGISASYFLNWPPGATIALISTLGYFSALALKKV